MTKKTIFGVYDSQGSAETLVRKGGITNYHLITYSFSNISAKNYQNWLICIEVIVCNVSVVFLRHSVYVHINWLIHSTYKPIYIYIYIYFFPIDLLVDAGSIRERKEYLGVCVEHLVAVSPELDKIHPQTRSPSDRIYCCRWWHIVVVSTLYNDKIALTTHSLTPKVIWEQAASPSRKGVVAENGLVLYVC